MRIGIIGAGQIGGTLARRLTASGHEVSIANSRGPETLASLAKETGAKPVTAREAARAGEVVVVTIPQKNVARLPADLFEGVPADVVVVDTGNYYPRQRDGRIDAIENGVTESRWVSDRLGRPVVKAFNSIYARSLLERGKPKGPRAASRSPSRATILGRRPSCSAWWMSWASTEWTAGAWTSRGGSSRGRRSTAPISTWPGSPAAWRRRSPSDRRGSGRPAVLHLPAAADHPCAAPDAAAGSGSGAAVGARRVTSDRTTT